MNENEKQTLPPEPPIATPPVDNDHVMAGCEPFDTPPTTPLETALTAAKTALSEAVRSARLNQISDTDNVNILETAFENAKNAVAGKAAIGHLQNAVNALKLATDLLANHSLKDSNDLKRVKNSWRAAETALGQLK